MRKTRNRSVLAAVLAFGMYFLAATSSAETESENLERISEHLMWNAFTLFSLEVKLVRLIINGGLHGEVGYTVNGETFTGMSEVQEYEGRFDEGWGGDSTMLAEKAEETVEVLLQTTKGNIVLELYPERTPITVKNFLQYVRDGHYDNTVVYRIESFLIQMGSKKPDLYDKPKRPPIENEADKGLKNERYTVGMARWGPHTADAEYYINTRNNPHLDFREKTDAGWGYVVFGKVVEGMHVVDAIAAVPTKEQRRINLTHLPIEEVLIRKVTVRGEEEIPIDTPASASGADTRTP